MHRYHPRRPRRDPKVLGQIVAKTDEVPLFVEELTRTVLESGLAGQAGVPDAHVCRLLPLTCLAPDVVDARWTGGSRGG